MTQTETQLAVRVPAVLPAMLTREQLALMCIGGTVLGSGGGGSYQVSRQILRQLPDGVAVPLVPLSHLPAGAWAAMVADMGAPTSLFGTDGEYQAPSNALAALEAYCGALPSRFPGFDGFPFLFPVETGAVNSLTPFVVAANGSAERAVVDADAAGRAIPSLQLSTFAGKLPLFPNYIASAGQPPQVSTGQVSTANETDAENALGGMIASPPFNGIAGLAMYAATGQQFVQSQPVPGPVELARRVGEIFAAAQGAERARAIQAYLDGIGRRARIVFEGQVTGMVQVEGEHDVGYVTVTAEDGTQLWIYNQNENLFASRGDTGPLVIGPDSICYVPHTGDPYDNSDLWTRFQAQAPVPGRVSILAVDAMPQVTSNPALMQTWQTVLAPFGYAGPYVQPWLRD